MNGLKKIIIFMIVTFKLFIYIINQTIWDSSLATYLYLMIIFLLALPFILKLKFTKTTFIKTFIVLLISLSMFVLYKEDNVFLYAIIALLTIDTEDREVVKMFFYSSIIICGITILFGTLGILPMKDAYRTIDGETDIRTSLGFPNANAVFSYLVPIILAGIYLFDKNPTFNIISLIITTVLFSFCKSRTGYYLTTLMLILNLFSKYKSLIKLGHKQFICFFIISILLAIIFGNTKYNTINILLSGRPWYYLNFIKLGPLAWGAGIPENMILDNLYLRLLANYSIIGLGLYYYIFNQGSKLCKNNDKILFAAFFLLLYGVFESVTVVNFVIVLFIKKIFISYREE